MLDRLRALCAQYREMILYLVFGCATTVVNWGAYALSVKYGHTGILWGNAISWVVATIFAFVTNKIWVFDSPEWTIAVLFKEFVLFFSTRFGTGLFEFIAVPALVHWGLDWSLFGVDGLISKMLVSIIVVILNYLFSKLLIFRRSDQRE